MNKSITLHNRVFQEPHGWLVDLVNRVSTEPFCNHLALFTFHCFLALVWFDCLFQFGELGGFTAIQAKLNADEIEIAVSPPPSPFLFAELTRLPR